MSYNGSGMLSGFFDGISIQSAAEALAEATIDHIDNAAFRDMYMDTMNEALTNGIDYMDRYDDGNYLKENLEDAMLQVGTDVTDMDLGITPGATAESYEDYGDEYAECDEACIREAIRKLPDGDPADAGTYFNLVNRVGAEADPEARAAIKEQLDMVSAFIPDTNIVSEDATAPITNELNFSNCREKCPEGYNTRTGRRKNSDGNDIVQPEAYIDQQKQVGEGYTDELVDIEDFFCEGASPITESPESFKERWTGEGAKQRWQEASSQAYQGMSPERQRIMQKVQTSQANYNTFQKQASSDPGNIDKYRQEMGAKNLAATQTQIAMRNNNTSTFGPSNNPNPVPQRGVPVRGNNSFNVSKPISSSSTTSTSTPSSSSSPSQGNAPFSASQMNEMRRKAFIH